MKLVLEQRRSQLINTDPLVWTEWEALEYTTVNQAHSRLEFWRSLNAYAVSQRGEAAKCEFRIKPTVTPIGAITEMGEEESYLEMERRLS